MKTQGEESLNDSEQVVYEEYSLEEENVTLDSADSDASSVFLPDLSKFSPDDLLILARAAEEIENHRDMRLVMKKLVCSRKVLGEEERLMFSTAYKYAVSKCRSSWRSTSEMLQKQEECEQQDKSLEPTSLYGISISGTTIEKDISLDSPLHTVARMIRGELEDISFEMIDIIRSKLLLEPLLDLADDRDESIVFYRKLIADYYRYLSEHLPDAGRSAYVTEATCFYDDAMKLAVSSLDAANATRLGLALNISVFYFEIMNKPDKACELAKIAYDAAVESLAGKSDAKDSMLLLDLLRENLTNWALAETS